MPDEIIQPSPDQGENLSASSSATGDGNKEGGASGTLTEDQVQRMIQSSNDKLFTRMEGLFKGNAGGDDEADDNSDDAADDTNEGDPSGNVSDEDAGQQNQGDQPEDESDLSSQSDNKDVHPLQGDIDEILSETGIKDIPEDSEAYKLIDFETKSVRKFLKSIETAAQAQQKHLEKQGKFLSRIPDSGASGNRRGQQTSNDPYKAFEQGYNN